MAGAAAVMTMDAFGVSPWELEVAHGYFGARFEVRQGELPEDPAFVSALELGIPVAFSQGFFDWFGFRRWEGVKSLLREMKRRRGSRRALRVRVAFGGAPAVSFVIDAADRRLYNHAVEKIDFVLELLPYHLGAAGLPAGVTAAEYRYDEGTRRWAPAELEAAGGRFVPSGGGWAPAPAPAGG